MLQRTRSADELNTLNDQVVPSIDFYFLIDLTPMEHLWDGPQVFLCRGQNLPSSMQDPGEKCNATLDGNESCHIIVDLVTY